MQAIGARVVQHALVIELGAMHAVAAAGHRVRADGVVW
jgi:hypothetical protein